MSGLRGLWPCVIRATLHGKARGSGAFFTAPRRVWHNRGNVGLPASSADASGLAGRYAAALFELAEERDALDAIAVDLGNLRSLLDESADLRRLIRSPVLSREDQGRAMTALAENYVGLPFD